jgi:hypothetical protein
MSAAPGGVCLRKEPLRKSSGRNWFITGGWYLLLTLLTIGFCAWIPFAHAARRLHSRALWGKTVLYLAGAVALVVLMAITPTDATGNIPDTPAGTTISIVGVCLMLTVIITALAAQWPLRRRVYPSTAPTAPPGVGTDPAVAAVLAARARRAEARALAAQDPVMARELHIGRPDLESSYDDGGLVDLNSAPTAVIAHVCDMEPAAAQAIVEARERMGSFSNLDEVLVVSDVSLGSWALLREHAILLPR